MRFLDVRFRASKQIFHVVGENVSNGKPKGEWRCVSGGKLIAQCFGSEIQLPPILHQYVKAGVRFASLPVEAGPPLGTRHVNRVQKISLGSKSASLPTCVIPDCRRNLGAGQTLPWESERRLSEEFPVVTGVRGETYRATLLIFGILPGSRSAYDIPEQVVPMSNANTRVRLSPTYAPRVMVWGELY